MGGEAKQSFFIFLLGNFCVIWLYKLKCFADCLVTDLFVYSAAAASVVGKDGFDMLRYLLPQLCFFLLSVKLHDLVSHFCLL